MSKKRIAGFIFKNTFTYLDHIAPLCSLLKIPIILTDSKIINLTKDFYPNLKILNYPDYCSIYKFLWNNYNIIFSCHILCVDQRHNITEIFTEEFLTSLNPEAKSGKKIFKVLFQENQEQLLKDEKKMKKKLSTIWLPHGHSDKGFGNKMFKALKEEKIYMVYGKKMLESIKSQNNFCNDKNKIYLGDYRFFYYQKNKIFYDQLINKITKKLNKKNKTILYAPTWDDYEDSSTFLEVVDILIKKLPKKYNLIIKPHPNTFFQHRIKIESLISECENIKNILVLLTFTPINPLLNFCDIYLGDHSSIGYDFLKFNKPMFFLNKKNKNHMTDPSFYLFRCGYEILPNNYDKIYEIIEKNFLKTKKQFSSIKKNIYKQTFSKTPNFSKLLTKIKLTLSQIHKEEEQKLILNLLNSKK